MRIHLLFPIFLLPSCGLVTSKHRPEVMIRTRSKPEFISRVSHEMAPKGWTLAEHSPSLVMLEQKPNETLMIVMKGYSHRPRARIRFVDSGGKSRIELQLSAFIRSVFGTVHEEPLLPGRYVNQWHERLQKAAEGL